MAKDSDAQLVLFTAFDCVDDTKLMGKAFVSDLVGLTTELAGDKNGRRAILYLLTPTSTKHFLPSVVKDLGESSEMARTFGTSKKDKDVRRKELVGYASEGLLEVVKGNAEGMVRDPGSGLVVQEIMLYTEGGESLFSSLSAYSHKANIGRQDSRCGCSGRTPPYTIPRNTNQRRIGRRVRSYHRSPSTPTIPLCPNI